MRSREGRLWLLRGLLTVCLLAGLAGLFFSFVFDPGFFNLDTGKRNHEVWDTYTCSQLLSLVFLTFVIGVIVTPPRHKRAASLIAAACTFGFFVGLRGGWVGAYLIQPGPYGFALLSVLGVIYTLTLLPVTWLAPPNTNQRPIRTYGAAVAVLAVAAASGWLVVNAWMGHTGRSVEDCAAVEDGYYSCFRVDLGLNGGVDQTPPSPSR